MNGGIDRRTCPRSEEALKPREERGKDYHRQAGDQTDREPNHDADDRLRRVAKDLAPVVVEGLGDLVEVAELLGTSGRVVSDTGAAPIEIEVADFTTSLAEPCAFAGALLAELPKAAAAPPTSGRSTAAVDSRRKPDGTR